MKKIKSRLFVIGVFAVFMLMAVACGSKGTKEEIIGSEDNSKDDNTDSKETNDSEASENIDKLETADNAKNTSLETINEAVLFDQDGVRVTAKEIVDDPIWGKGITVLIENDNTKNVGVQCNTIVVNNYMISDIFSSTVAAGKKDNETITLLSTSIEEAGIETISEINLIYPPIFQF